MQVPKEIRSQVICLHIQGRSEQEIGDTVDLSQDQVNVILSDLSSPEYQDALAYQLAVTFGKDGRDTNEFLEINEAKEILHQQGVLPKDTRAFITDVAEFSQTTGLGAGVFIPLFGIYNKYASAMGITNYQDIQKKSSQVLSALESYRNEMKSLQERYRQLKRYSS